MNRIAAAASVIDAICPEVCDNISVNAFYYDYELHCFRPFDAHIMKRNNTCRQCRHVNVNNGLMLYMRIREKQKTSREREKKKVSNGRNEL